MKKEILYGILLVILYLCMVYVIPQFTTVEHFNQGIQPDRLLKPFINPTGSLVALTGKVTDTLRASDIVLTPMRVLNDMNTDTEPKICIDIKDPIKGGNTLTPNEKRVLKQHTDMKVKEINNLEELCIDKTMIEAANDLNNQYGKFLNDLKYVDDTVKDVNQWAYGTYLNNTTGTNNTLLQYLDDNFYPKTELYTQLEADTEFERKLDGIPLTAASAAARYITLGEVGGTSPLTEAQGDSLYQPKLANVEYMTTTDASRDYLLLHSKRSGTDQSPYATRSFLDTKITEYDTKISDARGAIQRAYDLQNPPPLQSDAAAAARATLLEANPGPGTAGTPARPGTPGTPTSPS